MLVLAPPKFCEERYLASVSYDGSLFNGWAKQTKLFTVQGFIERTLSTVFSLEKFKILASSRTDNGVHALDQNFTFTLPFSILDDHLFSVLERSLQKFIKLNRLSKVPFMFHPLYNIQRKEYRYYIDTGDDNLFLRRYSWNHKLDISLTNLRKLLKIFEGFHDFFNFSYCRVRDRNRKNTFRKIEKISAFKSGSFLIIRILAKGFLRYQVRAIIGETIAMLNKSDAYEVLSKMLSTELSQKYRKLAPAGGLYL